LLFTDVSGQPIVSIFKGESAWRLKREPNGCTETSVTSYQCTLFNIPDERRSHLHLDGKLKSRERKPTTYPWFQASAAILLKSALFRDITQRVTGYHSTLRNVLEEHRSQPTAYSQLCLLKHVKLSIYKIWRPTGGMDV
jgi:hypothetical protein